VFELSSDAAGEDCSFVIGRLKCFIDLSELPPNEELDAGIYALIEPARDSPILVEKTRSTLWEPWLKDFEALRMAPKKYVFGHLELVNVNQIRGPTVVIHHLDNKNTRAYLRLVPRRMWGDMFDEWLEMDHTKVSYQAA
jgi:hypothetical protein